MIKIIGLLRGLKIVKNISLAVSIYYYLIMKSCVFLFHRGHNAGKKLIQIESAFLRKTGANNDHFFRWNDVNVLSVVATAAKHVAGHVGIHGT